MLLNWTNHVITTLFTRFPVHHSMNNPDARGVVVSDKDGLCLGSRGSLVPTLAPTIKSLLEKCTKLNDDASEAPIVTVETDSSMINIAYSDGFFTAVCTSSTTSTKS